LFRRFRSVEAQSLGVSDYAGHIGHLDSVVLSLLPTVEHRLRRVDLQKRKVAGVPHKFPERMNYEPKAQRLSAKLRMDSEVREDQQGSAVPEWMT